MHLLIRKPHLQNDQYLKYVLILSLFLCFFGGNIGNVIYDIYKIEPWCFTLNLYRFNFLLIIITLRDQVKKLITIEGYKIVTLILLNNFIDRILGIVDWSINDFLTIGLVLMQTKLITDKLKLNISTKK